MSSRTKKTKYKRNRYSKCDKKRQSFSERICDHLSEVILQYLSLEEKLRLECVSKQFQKTIVSNQRLLTIDFDLRHENSMKKVEYLLKKYPNINEIQIDFETFGEQSIGANISNQLIEIINKYCNNLTHFVFNSLDINDINLKKFVEKFGSKLVSIDLSESHSSKQFLTLTKQLNVENLIISRFDPQLSVIQFNNLKRLNLDLSFPDIELDQLEVFAERNANGVTHLSLEFEGYGDSMKHLLAKVSQFKNLVHLGIKTSNFEINDKLFAVQWKQIILNCNQLKSLECNYFVDENDGRPYAELWSTIGQMKTLRRLRVLFDKRPSVNDSLFKQMIQMLYKSNDLQCFNCLTHLTIEADLSIPVDGSVLTGIGDKLQNIQSLSIIHQMNVNKRSASLLGQLKSLRTLAIQLPIKDNKFYDEFEIKLRKISKKFKRIDYYISTQL